MYVLKIYIAGHTIRSQRAIENLKEIIKESGPDDYKLEIIDIIENPEIAEDKKIMATPAVIKELPPPIRRVIGDLSDREQVVMGLNLEAIESKSNGNG